MRKIFPILIFCAAFLLSQKTDAQVTLHLGSVPVACNSTGNVVIPVTVSNFNAVGSFQFTVDWDPAQLNFQQVSALNPVFLGQNVNFSFDVTTFINQGKFTFVWTKLGGLSVGNGTEVFTISYNYVGSGNADVEFVASPVVIEVTDVNGNEVLWATDNGGVTVNDNEPPSLTCPPNDTIQSNVPVAVSGIAPVFSDNCGTPNVGWTSTGSTNYNNPNDPDASGSVFNVGISTVQYTATDLAGNTSTCSFSIDIQSNVQGPDTLTVVAGNIATTCGVQSTFAKITTLNFDSVGSLQFSMSWDKNVLQFDSVGLFTTALPLTLADNFNVTQVLSNGRLGFLWFDNANVAGTTLPQGAELFRIYFKPIGTTPSNTALAFGDVPIVREAYSNAMSPSFEVPVKFFNGNVAFTDNAPPTITCPQTTVVQALPNQTSAPVTGLNPTTADNCGTPSLSYVRSAPTGGQGSGLANGTFQLGNTVVTYTATDAAGNTATCSFTVSIAGDDSLFMWMDTVIFDCGATGDFITIPIRVKNFDPIAGLQFNIEWDETVLSMQSVENIFPGLNLNLFPQFFQDTASGIFHFLGGSGGVWPNIPDGGIFFELKFKILDASATTSLDFIALPGLPIEALNDNIDPVFVVTTSGYVEDEDTTPPTIVCPPNAVAQAGSGLNFASIGGLEATTSDDCNAVTYGYVQTGATLGNGQGPANGVYQLGVTEVIYTATDAAGNTATCSFSVLVIPADTLFLSLDSVALDCKLPGATLTVPIRVENFKNIGGVSFNVGWDETVLSMQSVENVFPGLNLQFFPQFFQDTNAGLFYFLGGAGGSWPNIPDDGVLFELKFKILKINTHAPVQFFNLPGLPIEGFNSNLLPITVATEDGDVKIADFSPAISMTCPPNLTISAVANECQASVTIQTPGARDVCNNILQVTSNHPSNLYSAGLTTVVFTATGLLGNTSTCSMTVLVVEDVPPNLFNCPNNFTVAAPSGQCTRVVTWQHPLITDGCGNTTFDTVLTHVSGTAFPIGTTTVQYTVTDNTDNTVTCVFTVTVRDTTPPTVNCPANLMLETPLGECFVKSGWPMPASQDACDNSLALTSTAPTDSIFQIGTTPIVFTATDDSGNKSSCSITVQVVDVNPPGFVGGCPQNVTVYANDTQNNDCGATATWTNPALSGLCSNNGLVLTSTHTPGSFFTLGTTEVKLFATSPVGVKDSCSFLVTVLDTVAPVFTSVPANLTVDLPANACSTPVSWAAATASDLCAGVVVTSDSIIGSIFPLGTTTVTFTATDGSGNTATGTMTITVRDVTDPTINNCPADVTVTVTDACDAQVTWPTILATDFCDSNVEILPANVLSGGTFPAGDSTIRILAVDDSGNYDTCEVKIKVIASNNPRFVGCPSNQLHPGCSSPPVSWISPTTAGFCGSVALDSTLTWGSVLPVGVHTVTFTATDNFGSTATCSFTITVNESVEPKISCPEPITVDVAGRIISDQSQFLMAAQTADTCSAVTLVFNNPSVSDNCLDVLIAQTAGPKTGENFPLDMTTITFKATDGAGNTALCDVEITVVGLPKVNASADNEFGCEGETIVLQADMIPDATYTWTGPQQQYPNTAMISILMGADNDGQYTVFATINGCNTPTDTVNLTFIGKPDAVDDTDIKVLAGESIQSIDVLVNDQFGLASDAVVTLVSPVEGVKYEGNGIFSYAGTESPGTVKFLYTLCSKNCPEQCDMATVTITVQDVRCVFIPNIITPNGDGINDDFYIPCLDTQLYPNNSIQIYNQWGDKVYEKTPYVNGNLTGWKGTLNGEADKDLPDGVYYYIFKTSQAADAQVYKGFVEIYR